MKKSTSIVLSTFLLAAIAYRLVASNGSASLTQGSSPNVQLNAGAQHIQIDVQNTAYSPSTTIAAANLPSTLTLSRQNTYGCTRTTLTHALQFNQLLSETGETTVDLGTHQAGEEIEGVCGMGMYHFKIKFL